MNRYLNAKIYTISCSTNDDLIYVGSTIEKLLSQRFARHKSVYKNPKEKGYSMLLYEKMREIGFDNFYIELYEIYPCDNKQELNKREGEVIREIGTLNRKISGRTKKEFNQDYYQTNKEKLKQDVMEYRENNQEKCKQYFIEYNKTDNRKEWIKQNRLMNKVKPLMVE